MFSGGNPGRLTPLGRQTQPTLLTARRPLHPVHDEGVAGVVMDWPSAAPAKISGELFSTFAIAQTAPGNVCFTGVSNNNR